MPQKPYPASLRAELHASFFLGHRLLASGVIIRPQVVSFPLWNVLYVCRVCGDSWGRVVVDSGGWHICESFCPRHDPASLPDLRPYGFPSIPKPPGGSFLQYLPFDERKLPFPVLLYEFELWSKHYDDPSD